VSVHHCQTVSVAWHSQPCLDIGLLFLGSPCDLRILWNLLPILHLNVHHAKPEANWFTNSRKPWHWMRLTWRIYLQKSNYSLLPAVCCARPVPFSLYTGIHLDENASFNRPIQRQFEWSVKHLTEAVESKSSFMVFSLCITGGFWWFVDKLLMRVFWYAYCNNMGWLHIKFSLIFLTTALFFTMKYWSAVWLSEN